MPKPTLIQTHKQNETQPKMPFQWVFLLPNYWGIWLVMALFLPLVYLPLRHQFWCGRQLGKLAWRLAKKRRNDTLTNLNLAYPNKSASEKQQLAQQVFINQGIGLFESLSAWFRPNVFAQSFSASGVQHITTAQAQNKAVILLGAHYTMLDLGGQLATQFFAIDCLYRPQNNALLEWLIYNRRRQIFEQQIPNRDIKRLAKRIKIAKVIWYTPDQDFGLEHGVMAPFFGVPAATITAQRRLVRLDKNTSCAVVMMAMTRTTPAYLKKGTRPHYHLTFTAIDNYPSDNELDDAIRINHLLEQHISTDISQWMWFHRRFKTQPSGIDYYNKNTKTD